MVYLTMVLEAVSSHHLPAHLNEFTFRFNRRFYPMVAVDSVLGIMANIPGRTYKDLYKVKQQELGS